MRPCFPLNRHSQVCFSVPICSVSMESFLGKTESRLFRGLALSLHPATAYLLRQRVGTLWDSPQSPREGGRRQDACAKRRPLPGLPGCLRRPACQRRHITWHTALQGSPRHPRPCRRPWPGKPRAGRGAVAKAPAGAGARVCRPGVGLGGQRVTLDLSVLSRLLPCPDITLLPGLGLTRRGEI